MARGVVAVDRRRAVGVAVWRVGAAHGCILTDACPAVEAGLSASPIDVETPASRRGSLVRMFAWWSDGDSNPGPSACHADALPAELSPRGRHSSVSSPEVRSSLRGHRGRPSSGAQPTMRTMAADRHTYRLRRSDRARRARLTVTREGEIVVVLPRRMPDAEADRLVLQHAVWLDRHVSRISDQQAMFAARPPLGEGRVLEVAGEPLRISEVDGGSQAPGARSCRARASAGCWSASAAMATRHRSCSRAGCAGGLVRSSVSASRRGSRSWRCGPGASPSAINPAAGHRPHRAARSPSAGGCCWRRRSCWTRSWCTNWRTCASVATRPPSGRSWSSMPRGPGRLGVGYARHASEVRAALD